MFEFHLNVKTMTYMAMFAALQLVLEFLTQFTPSMPQGGNVAFSLIAIFLCSYLMGPLYGVIVGLVCCGLHFALGFATFYGPLSVIFDYVLPLGVCGLAGMFKDGLIEDDYDSAMEYFSENCEMTEEEKIYFGIDKTKEDTINC